MDTTTEEKTGKSERIIFPQDMKITFSNLKNIFIGEAGFLDQEDKKVYGMLDNLTVTDNEEFVRQVNPDPEVSANVMISLINLTSFLLAKQIKPLIENFSPVGVTPWIVFSSKSSKSSNCLIILAVTMASL